MKTIIYTTKSIDVKTNTDSKILIIIGETIRNARNNNADCIILNDFYPAILKKEKNFAHLKEIIIPIKITPITCLFTFGLRSLLKGQIKIEKKLYSNIYSENFEHYITLSVHPRKNRLDQRDFYPPDWTSLKLLQEIDKLKIKYVSLRWPEQILSNAPLSDVDLLVDDEDAIKLRALLESHIGTKAVDIHTVHGGEPGRGDQMAYFPPHIAKQILENRILLSEQGGQVPNLNDQFRSLAYHAVFNKGVESGLSPTPKKPAQGKIFEELKRLQKYTNIRTNLSLPELLSFLKAENWMPPLDMVVRKSHKNKWLRIAFDLNKDLDAGLNYSYFAVFIRKKAKDWNISERLECRIENDGFKIIASAELDPKQVEVAASQIRGGNWSAGLWPISGGPPFKILLIEDKKQIKPTRSQKRGSPSVHNARIFEKNKWRNFFNSENLPHEQSNILHTSDSNQETIEYLNLLFPDWVEKLR